MVKTTVAAGVCGFTTEIKASSEDYQHVVLGIVSNCEKIQTLATKLSFPLDAFNEIRSGFNGELYTIIRQNLTGCCAGCAVSVGLFKSIQVAAKLNLPQNIIISLSDSITE